MLGWLGQEFGTLSLMVVAAFGYELSVSAKFERSDIGFEAYNWDA